MKTSSSHRVYYIRAVDLTVYSSFFFLKNKLKKVCQLNKYPLSLTYEIHI